MLTNVEARPDDRHQISQVDPPVAISIETIGSCGFAKEVCQKEAGGITVQPGCEAGCRCGPRLIPAALTIALFP